MTERVRLGAGYLFLHDDDQETIYLALAPGTEALIPGIHVAIGAIGRHGELEAMIVLNKQDYLMGERVSLGSGIIMPHQKGIRLRAPDDPRKNKLKGAPIRRLIRHDVRVILEFLVEQ